MSKDIKTSKARRSHVFLVHLVLFPMFGAMMFCSKLIMEGLPNIHPLGMFIALFTVVYGVKALIPIYIYVFIQLLYAGFATWCIPYLYIWAVLWLMIFLVPKRLSEKARGIIYPVLCALHGLCFGLLYAPFQMIMYNLSFKATLVWIANGLYFDMIHGIGNFALGLLVLPLSKVLAKLESKIR